MNERPGVVVAVPAHDEEATIAECLDSLVRALRWARRRRVIAEATIQVVAHRCSDRTWECARDALPDHLAEGVAADDRAVTIGRVRGRAVARGLAALARPSASTWIFSTDADTIVPRRWVVDMLRSASRHDADVVVGLAELDRFRGSRPAQAAYEAILRAGYHRDGSPMNAHDHVYGANLAVRADAYLRVGGFPDVAHGEDRLLVQALVESGARVLRTRDVAVTTSGRLIGRAPDGLAGLLRGLDETSHVSV